MSLFSMFEDKIVSFFLSSILDKIVPTSSSLKTMFSSVETRLDHIQNAQEMQQSMWLKSSFTFLDLQDYDKATDELIRAEASDKRNASARLCLSILLGNKGNLKLAKEKLNEAIQINPFIPLICFDSWDDSQHPLGFLHFPSALEWSEQLNSERFLRESSTQNWLNHLLKENQANIYSASLSGGKLVVSWQLHSPDLVGSVEEKDDTEQELSCFEPSTGNLNWSRNIQGQELVLATPYYVVLQEESGKFNFLNASDGSYSSSMGQDYFYTTFFPMFDKISGSREYANSNKRFHKKAWIMNDYKEKNKQNLNELNMFFKLISSGIDYSEDDIHKISLPYVDNGYSFELKNHWFKGVTRSSHYSRKAVFLDAIFCDAFISCCPHEVGMVR